MSTQSRSRGRKLAEMVEAEATRAETDEPDEDTDEDTDTDESADEEAAEEVDEPEAASLEASLAAFEAEHTRHRETLRTIMGDDFSAFHECETCGGVGYAPGRVLMDDPGLERCAACEGEGFLRTHALRDDKRVRECLQCQGNGYVVKVESPPPPNTTTVGQPRPMFDPYTGQPLAANPNGTNIETPYAPGYVPPAQAAPPSVPGR